MTMHTETRGRGAAMKSNKLGWWRLLCAAPFLVTLISSHCAFAEGTASMMPIVVARDERPTRLRLEQNVGEIINALTAWKVGVSDGTQAIIGTTEKLTDFEAIGAIQRNLDEHSLLSVSLSDEAWFTVTPASPRAADRALTRGRWRSFLVKIDNSSRVTSPLGVRSPQALSELSEENKSSTDYCVDQQRDWSKWFLMRLIGPPAMPASLSGREVEYFVLQLCSLDTGDRAAEFTFYLGGGQVSQGHYGSTMMVFKIGEPAAP